MRFALVNPPWRFDGSIYFGCRDPHLPLELGYARQMLAAAGHEVLLIDAHLEHASVAGVRERVAAFAPDFTVVATAPTYLFWRCPPPELRVPAEVLDALGDAAGWRVLAGPHPSSTPRVALEKAGADIAVMGECEETLVRLGERDLDWVPGVAYYRGGECVTHGPGQTVDLAALPVLTWPQAYLDRHRHHHHRFDEPQHGLGAEIEASRGCPYSCSFCAKTDHRDQFRWRPLETMLAELDGLIAQGVGYVYFIDEIFLPNRELLQALAERPVSFGVQTRIDLWKPEMLDRLAAAGCVSIEAGIESITEGGREALNKNCRLDTPELQQRLIRARRGVPFVQATLMQTSADEPEVVDAWRASLHAHGIWANEPVPAFPYPGSPDYAKLWGLPDEHAWERAVDHYLTTFDAFSDIQEERPRPLWELEASIGGGR